MVYLQAAIDAQIAELQAKRLELRTPQRRVLLEMVRGHAIVLASHDDETLEEVEENHADGITISEFPVRLAAACAAQEHGDGCDRWRPQYRSRRLALRQCFGRRSPGGECGRCPCLRLCAACPDRGGLRRSRCRAPDTARPWRWSPPDPRV